MSVPAASGGPGADGAQATDTATHPGRLGAVDGAVSAARWEAAGPDEDVQEQLTRARAVIEHAPDAIVILDVDSGCLESVNAAAEELFGTDRVRLRELGPVEVSPAVQPEGRRSAEAAWAYVEQALTGGRPRFEWTHQRADGRPVPCEATLLRLPGDGRRLVRGSILGCDVVTVQRALGHSSATITLGVCSPLWPDRGGPHPSRSERPHGRRAADFCGLPADQELVMGR